MPTATLICRNCGKPYQGCRNAKSVPGVYRWQDVACSPECGEAYLKAILISRGEYVEPEKEQPEAQAAVQVSAAESGDGNNTSVKKRTRRSAKTVE